MKRLLTAVLFFTVLGAGVAHAGPPTRFIKTQVKGVRTLLAAKVVKDSPEAAKQDVDLKAIIDPLMEFDKLSERALRKHWATLKPAERDRFIALFRDLVFHSYLSKVRSADEAYTVDYEGEEPKPDQGATVTAIAKTKKAEIELVFHLAARPGGKFVTEDIIIDEVSLVDNYREQFNKIIAADGFDALLKKMENKLRKLGADPAKSGLAPAPAVAPDPTAPGTPTIAPAPTK